MFEPIDYKKLDEVFNQFAGRELTIDRVDHAVPQDKVIAELKEALQEMGLCLRVKLPGQIGDFSCMPNRVNVYVGDFSNDGKFRIGTGYKIG